MRTRVRGPLKSKSRDVIAAYVTRAHGETNELDHINMRAPLTSSSIGSFLVGREHVHYASLANDRIDATLRIRLVFFISARGPSGQRTCRLPKLRARCIVNFRAHINT